MDFDEDRIYYSHQNLAAGPNANNNGADGQQQRPPGHAEAMLDLEDGAVDLGAVRRHFREFLRELNLAPRLHAHCWSWWRSGDVLYRMQRRGGEPKSKSGTRRDVLAKI